MGDLDDGARSHWERGKSQKRGPFQLRRGPDNQLTISLTLNCFNVSLVASPILSLIGLVVFLAADQNETGNTIVGALMLLLGTVLGVWVYQQEMDRRKAEGGDS